MSDPLPIGPAEVLAIQLNAAFTGRKASLERERALLPADAKDSTNKEQFQVRVIEARLKTASEDPQASVAVLASLALSEAEALDAEAKAVAPLTVPGGRPVGMLRLVLGLLRCAQTTESKARSLFSLARQGRRWEGVEQARVLDADHEQLYLAVRRFEALLQAGKAWETPDVEWLRLRAVALPARLQQTVAELRAAAEGAAQSPLPPDLDTARQPFLAKGFNKEDGLAWCLGGFNAHEAKDWMDAGLGQPAQAALWRARGLDLATAKAWSSQDLMADEAALFRFCGVAEPGLAHQLRSALGDVEMMGPWHRAGYAPEEVLALRAEGCRGPDQAPPPKPKEAPPPPDPGPMKAEGLVRFASSAPPAAKATPPVAGAAKAEVPPPVAARAAELVVDGSQAPTRLLKVEATWPRLRAEQLFGMPTASDAEALALAVPSGCAWLGWGTIQPAGLATDGSAESFVWAQGGHSLVVMAASELTALSGKATEVPDMRPDPLWQEALDPLRHQLGLPKHAGTWMLMGSSAEAGTLAWGLVHPAGPPPWAQAVDYQEFESWTARWARKTEEWGEEGKAPNAKVGKLMDGSWWIALPELTLTAEAEPQSLSFTVVKPAWTESLQEFCLKMEMPAKAGKWRLFGMPLKALP